jgi:hypothetical protein
MTRIVLELSINVAEKKYWELGMVLACAMRGVESNVVHEKLLLGK